MCLRAKYVGLERFGYFFEAEEVKHRTVTDRISTAPREGPIRADNDVSIGIQVHRTLTEVGQMRV